MTVKTVFRYDDQDYSVGTIMLPRGDHLEGLTEHQKTVELAIRAKVAPSKIRETSLYTWREKATALRLWPHCRKKYLYDLKSKLTISSLREIWIFTRPPLTLSKVASHMTAI